MTVSTSTQDERDTRPALPAPAGPLFGRQAELRALAGALSRPGLVTLTGLGGSGKTTLALRLARELSASFTGRVWWCDLGPLTDPALVPYAVAAALGLSDTLVPVEAARRVIGAAPTLLVLDNCEHVAAAAADLIHALMTDCLGLRALATSLQPLGAPGEQVWPLGPLPVPSASEPFDQLAAEPAVALFAARAKVVAPGFELTSHTAPLVAAICRRLDGLPLAIELAAARAGMLSLEQILSHLAGSLTLLTRAQPPAGSAARHHALRATLEWGYRLLSDEEQRLFRSLSVFPASFALETVAGVEGAPESGLVKTLDMLSSLVNKSLLVVGELPARGAARYRMLEPVRVYARELLEAAGEGPATRDRQLRWAVSLAEALAPQLITPEAGLAIARIEADYDTLRAALRWAITSRQIEVGMRLAAALFRFWFNRGPLSEGRSWCEELLNAPADTSLVSPAIRARVAFTSGRLACRQGDDRTAAQRGAESLRLARQAGAREDEARALDLLGLAAHDGHDFMQAIAHYRAAIDLRRALGNSWAVAVSLNNLGLVHFECADYDEAAACFTAALEAAAQAGAELIPPYENLAEVETVRGDLLRAASHARRGLALAQSAGDQHSLASARRMLGVIARLQGHLDEAASLAQAALDAFLRLDSPINVGDAQRDLGDVRMQRGEMRPAQEAYSAALEAHQKVGYLRGMVEAQGRLALLSAARGATTLALSQAREVIAPLLDLLEQRRATFRRSLIEAVEAAGLALAASAPDQAGQWLATATTERARLKLPRMPPWREIIEAACSKAIAPATPLTLEAAARQILAAPAVTSQRNAQPIVSTTGEPRIRVRALGRAEVLVAGQPVKASAWVYHKARELCFYLLDRPPTSKAQIGLDLWPEASSAQLRNYLHRSLHFIRKVLGDPDAVHFESGQYSIRPGPDLWYDVAEFEAGLQRAAALGSVTTASAERRAEMGELLQAAIALWDGEFLADLDAGEWAVLRREELCQSYLRALIDLGQLRGLEARYAEAIAIWQRALTVDPYLELAQRELMRCLARQGEIAAALSKYERLRELLAAELDASPSHETTALYERIRRGDDV